MKRLDRAAKDNQCGTLKPENVDALTSGPILAIACSEIGEIDVQSKTCNQWICRQECA